MRRRRVLAALLAAVAPATARAGEPSPLRNTGAGFLGLETAGVVAVFATYSIAAGDPRATCTWCTAPGFDEAARNRLRSSDSVRSGAASHAFSLGFAPAAALVGVIVPAVDAGRPGWAARDAWIMGNAFLLTTGLVDGTKKLTSRRRPAWVHGRGAETHADPVEENLSFPSGDTAWAFTFASSATTLAALHGYRAAPAIGVGGFVLASTAGVLRVAADMHWASDVAAGALLGTLVGVGLPLALHGRERAPLHLHVRATRTSSTLGLGGSF